MNVTEIYWCVSSFTIQTVKLFIAPVTEKHKLHWTMMWACLHNITMPLRFLTNQTFHKSLLFQHICT